MASCGPRELLDPDYLPGALKSIPQGSVETLTTHVLASSSSSSPRTSSKGLPVTPDAHFMERAKLRGRAHSLRTSAGDATSLPLDSGLPLPLSSFDEAIEDVATAMTGPPIAEPFELKIPSGQSQGEPNEVNYDFMAMAMSMSTGLEGEIDFGLGNGNGNEVGGGGDYGFGFDINNFSFDMGDFSALLGQQAQAQGQGEWDTRPEPSGSGYGV